MGLGWIRMCVCWVFFVYGVAEFIRRVIYDFKIWERRKRWNKGKMVLVVKDVEGDIEVLLRMLDYYGIEVEVRDEGSTDETGEIVRRLCEELDGVRFLEG